MGCYHLGKFVSKALGKCNGRERGWREERFDYAMAYPPGPPTETYYMRPVARTVTFSAANSVYVIPPAPEPAPHHHQQPPDPQPQPTPPPPQQQHEQPDHHQPQQDQSPPPPPQNDAPPAEAAPKPPKRSGNKSKKTGRVRFGPEQTPPPPEQQQQEQQQAPPPPWYFRYTPSPLPRWEAATPRRHEYFSGEYRYSYPTPVREGIYRMATDANRLTTIFSEENPNACVIM